MTALRIKRLSLTDFRAFPGPAPAHFDLDGKNLLVYGENGAGKSSIFHALREFFALKPARRLDDYRNVFSKIAKEQVAISVDFDDGGTAANWHLTPATGPLGLVAAQQTGTLPLIEHHPVSRPLSKSDQRVSQAALRRACLDFRSLLDTNYKQEDGDINLFDIAVNHLIHDFPVTVAGGQIKTVGELWQAVLLAKPARHGTRLLARVNTACAEFNAGFKQALDALHPFITTLLGEFTGADVAVTPFEMPGVTYHQAHYLRDRDFNGKSLKLGVTFRSHALSQPQHFLNEGRLSALGLAIYLGGRLACTPSAPNQALKLLVLDDVLIGLDHSNRIPVLDVLHTHFADWQIVMLTHDRNWFDLARHRLPDKDWVCQEIYEGDPAATVPMPIYWKTENRPAKALLAKGRQLLMAGYIEAAANYVRQACEMGLRGACEFKKIKLNYLQDSTKHKSQDLFDGLKHWTATGKVTQADWDAMIQRLELLKNVVMNPYSHPSAPNIPRQEVLDAADAVERFLELAGTK